MGRLFLDGLRKGILVGDPAGIDAVHVDAILDNEKLLGTGAATTADFLTDIPRSVAGRRAQGTASAYFAGSVRRRSRSAFAMTDAELRLIAAAAIIGLSSRPKIG